MNKKIFVILLSLFINLVFVPSIFATSIKINGGILDIYETDGSNEAIFDKSTNTLTLNGYNNDYILFEGFDGKTINVVLKGINTISSGGYIEGTEISGLGFDYNTSYDEVVMNIRGEENSKLNIKGYYNGIYIPDGTLNISNTNLKFEDIYYVDVYTYYGELISIKDSEIKTSGTNYPIANDSNDIELDNIKYTSLNTSNDDFYAYGNLKISNSLINVTNSNCLSRGEDTLISNSNINYINGSEFISSNNLEIKNSNVNVEVNDIAMYVYLTLKIDNSDVFISSKEGVALFLGTEEIKDFNDVVILNDVIVREDNLIPSVVDTHSAFFGIIYSYFIEEPSGNYTEENVFDLADIAAKEIHFDALKSVSFDSNGGSGSMRSIKISGKYILPKSEFTPPEGKQFMGWSLNKSGEIISSVNVNENITVYAIWEDIIENPKTIDNILLYVSLLFISIFSVYLLYRKNKNM